MIAFELKHNAALWKRLKGLKTFKWKVFHWNWSLKLWIALPMSFNVLKLKHDYSSMSNFMNKVNWKDDGFCPNDGDNVTFANTESG